MLSSKWTQCGVAMCRSQPQKHWAQQNIVYQCKTKFWDCTCVMAVTSYALRPRLRLSRLSCSHVCWVNTELCTTLEAAFKTVPNQNQPRWRWDGEGHTNCNSDLRTQSLRETMLQSDRRARTPSTPQTDVARPFQNIQSEDLSTLFQTLSVQVTDLVQRSSPEGSLVHALDDHHLRPPQHVRQEL